MKAFIISLCLLLVICIFVGIHSVIMLNLADDIDNESQKVTKFAQNNQWDEVVNGLDKIKSIWDKWRIWSSFTISTDEIEQIDISIKQSRTHAELKQKSDFFGEFTMFTMLLDHIPHHEGFHIEEIL